MRKKKKIRLNLIDFASVFFFNKNLEISLSFNIKNDIIFFLRSINEYIIPEIKKISEKITVVLQ